MNRPTTGTTGNHTLSPESLARALLTYCVDGPDALLHATLLGAGGAQELLEALRETSVSQFIEGRSSRGMAHLDGMFLSGLARWGRHADQRSMTRFHRAASKWRQRLASLNSAGSEDLIAWLTGNGHFWVIGPDDPSWPDQLGDLATRSDWAPPLCLWGRGDPAALVSCPTPLAVVGSRSCNDYGRFVARQVGLKAAEGGHLVVSGGAFGADANAHWGALSAARDGAPPPGRTVAVFAGGLDHMGPRHNAGLFAAIERQGGALISELPPGTIPEARRFLLRNRIIAALARTVVVAQARHRSGALNTATWAAELGREVYAAPGGIDNPENTGCNHLIHDGKAMILISANNLEGICHASHEPIGESPTPTAGPGTTQVQAGLTECVTEPTVASAARPTDGNHGCDDDGRSKKSRKDLPEEQRTLLKAVRACRARHLEATCENVSALLEQEGHPAYTLQEVLQTAGAMELTGLLASEGGVLTPTRDGQEKERR
ncbi:DNA-processing protein DprA [Bifidobacterium xylocopae]|uniref:DNA processing protein DprA n=1 Tax=Bifidobacterium xylocopae TaxID=2493119 RepID=A0A366KH24_9BIFI|nr:DNA-processing protein DprA [Bifidobacterium xylocopae]RBP99991.1 DNA processing protein DprA [Bifidobacterium xylocopae]